jgi:DNA repair protein RadA/Sms
MPKPAAQLFVCTKCDAQFAKWGGQCLECGAWGTVVAESEAGRVTGQTAKERPSAGKALSTTAFSELPAQAEKRIATSIGELDRVLGGGIVPGAVLLLGGEPGVGKSTVALMAAARLAAGGKAVLYASGEESAGQVALRAKRLGAMAPTLRFVAATDPDDIAATVAAEKPALAVIDSVQTLTTGAVPGESGGVAQIRYAAARLVELAKSSGVPLLLIGHVTKDGQVAGPKTLEHLVDAVFSFEGDSATGLRVLRATKNRFGPTDECGMFAMDESGLVEITNPSAYLLDERRPGTPGSVICATLEGTRPVLAEVQALVQRTGFGYPARRASGFDGQRLEMLCAVISRHAGVDLHEYDVYLNVVGGLKLREPAADLAACLAILSSHANVALPQQFAAWGEVGLSGDVRSSPGHDKRLAECNRLGIGHVVAAEPRGKAGSTKAASGKTSGVALHACADLHVAAGMFAKAGSATPAKASARQAA